MTEPTRPSQVQATDPTMITPLPTEMTVVAEREATRPTQLEIPQSGSVSSSGTHHGQQWGDFRFGDLLGRGGMGAVYRGQQVSLDRPVAIKVLPSHLSDNASFRDRFVIEAKSVARINSPHVIQVYGAGVHEGHHYFAMELVAGQDLAQVLKTSGKPSRTQAIDWVLQAARGLAAAGELDIIHRDIKPANLMLTKKGVVKVMDFGLARLASEGHSLTMTGTVMGTVSYFSPEQGRGERCDCRTDIYALGVTFYELLTGGLPFTGADAPSIIYQHIHVEPRPPRQVDVAIPEDVQAVVLKCMAKDAAQRYQTAASLVADLEAIAQGRPPAIPAAELSALRRGLSGATPTPRSTTPWGFIIGGVVTACAITAAGMVFVRGPEDPPVAPAPPSPSATAPTVTISSPPPITGATEPPPIETTPAASAPATATAIAPPPFDPEPLKALLDAGRFTEARALLTEANRTRPDDAKLGTWAEVIDQVEGGALLSQGREALHRGDLDTAAARSAAAAVLLTDSPDPRTLAEETATRRTISAKATADADLALTEGRLADAESLITSALSRVPGHPALLERSVRIKSERERQEDRVRRAQVRTDEGISALGRKDPEAALAAFSAAIEILPEHAPARDGQSKARGLLTQITEATARFDAALDQSDVAACRTALEQLTALSPQSPATRSAEGRLASLTLRLEEERRMAEELELSRSSKAAGLAKLLDDRTVPLPTLEDDFRRFLTEAGPDRPERALLERKLEDRRQLAVVERAITGLDAAILAQDTAGIARIVRDERFREGLTRLTPYPGLVFESRVDSFLRQGDKATARLAIRHALAVFPERTLTYVCDLQRLPDGWVIAGALLQDQTP